MGTSQLGGAVYGNPNLNQNADIILNEVGSTNPSVLKGALEVFGKNAAVVIANPIALEIMLTSFVSLAYKPSLSMIKSEVRSLLILKPVIAPSLIRDCPLTIVSFEVLIKEQLIVTEKGAGVNTVDGNIITDLSNLEITADGDLVLRANLSSQTDINLTSHHGDITQSGDIKAAQDIDINTTCCQLPTLIVNGIGSNG
jgi:filamentous hemagglutinin family protein